MNKFDPTSWVLVTDEENCPFTERQLRTLHDHGVSKISRIECSSAENTNKAPCTDVPMFPAFCNKTIGKCIGGLQNDLDTLEARLAGA